MTIFAASETRAILISLLFIFIFSTINFRISLRRSRDAQRKADLGSMAAALEAYQNDFGFFPAASDDGQIMACEPVQSEVIAGETIFHFSPCLWGEDALRDVFDKEYPAYRERLPIDPKHTKGYAYRYFSNGSYFQLYAALEGQEEVDELIVSRNIYCGLEVCEFGKSYADIPLDRSIEQYVQEIQTAKE